MAKAEERKAIIAARLREARRMAGLSQAQVAKMLGLHRPSVTESEAGNRKVSADEIAQFARLYDVSAAWLLGEDAEQLDIQNDKVQLAARELQKLDPKDLDRLLVILSSMRRGTDL